MIGSILALALLQQPDTFSQKVPAALSEFKMVRLPDGKVTVNGKDFEIKNLYIGETEMTWDVYDVYTFAKELSEEDQQKRPDAKSRPSRPYGAYDRGFGHQGYPAIGVHLNAANQFCVWLTKVTGRKYRLPTEPEWEYAARAATSAEPASLEPIAWFWDNADDATQPVGKKEPNKWGLYDVLGNAAEWCASLDENMVARGGSYRDKKDKVSFSYRLLYSPEWQAADAHFPKSVWWLSNGPFVGFRVVCEGK
ncbi:MAG TPA: SUMF1/EgtB/PvdO family nonheme iron enzyme [Fimbriimonas sp.]|nr:SUMF1/EgtB/PvdO family nonheme iron enzyme [Fimbriimonas sp.]